MIVVEIRNRYYELTVFGSFVAYCGQRQLASSSAVALSCCVTCCRQLERFFVCNDRSLPLVKRGTRSPLAHYLFIGLALALPSPNQPL
eukprot:scaffold1152_cov174-Skeletonema_marinoi.AAC.4